MAVAKVQDVATDDNFAGPSGNQNIIAPALTVGNLIVIVAWQAVIDMSSFSVTGGSGNAWNSSALTTLSANGGGTFQIFWRAVAAGDSGATFAVNYTRTGSTSRKFALWLIECSGATTIGDIDYYDGSAVSANYPVPPLTPTTSADLEACYYTASGASTTVATAPSGMTAGPTSNNSCKLVTYTKQLTTNTNTPTENLAWSTGTTGIGLGFIVVGSTTTTITIARTLLWNTKSTISQAKTLLWNTKATITASRILKWNTRAAITTLRTLLWNTKQTISTGITLLWNTLVQEFYQNSFEGGVNVTAITAANSGGASGDAFSSVTVGGGTSLTYDNTYTSYDLLAAKLSIGAIGSSVYVTYIYNAVTNVVAVRAFIYLENNMPGFIRLIKILNGSTSCANIRISGTGKLDISDATDTRVDAYQFATFINLNKWFRIEGQFNLSPTAGQATVSLYDGNSSTPLETYVTNPTQNFGSNADRVRFGVTIAAANVLPFWLDSIAINNTGVPIGPVPLTHISLTRTSLWNVLQTIQQTKTLLWNTRLGFSLSRILRWNTNRQVIQFKVLKWNTKQTIIPSRVLLWNTRKQFTITRILRWNTRKSISTNRILRWNSLQTITINRILRWNVRTGIAVSKTLLWNVVSRIQISRTLLWETFRGWIKTTSTPNVWTEIPESDDIWTEIPKQPIGWR